MTQTLYARVSDEAHAYVSGLAQQCGLSIAAVTDAILEEARRREWTVDPRPALIKEPARDG